MEKMENPLKMELWIEKTIKIIYLKLENGPFIDDFPIKTSIYKWFSMAMLNNQRVMGFDGTS